jgi:hypothetical protein
MSLRKTFAWLVLAALSLGGLGCGNSDKDKSAPASTIPLQPPPKAGAGKAPVKDGKTPANPSAAAH